MRALLALALIGCIFSPKPKTLTENHEIGPSCLRLDSTTWVDTLEVDHWSCHIGDSLPNPRPPAP